MSYFLSIQNTYTAIELALFNDQNLIDQVGIDKLHASILFISLLDDLLRRNNITTADITFIATNKGPGPFTTLRVVIASVNGLAFATGIPLIGVDGLDALLLENSTQSGTTVALLNAFNKDVYYGINNNNAPFTKGYGNIFTLLEQIKNQTDSHSSINFIGNGTTLYKKEIEDVFGSRAYIADQIPQTSSVKMIGLMGLEKWNTKQDLTNQLFPLYLKALSY